MINPIALTIFGFDIYWYGLLWLLGFLAARLVALRFSPLLLNQRKDSRELADELVTWCFFGALVGGRLGYVLIYGWHEFSKDFLWLFKLWQGGMSFHGGLVGVVCTIVLLARWRNVPVMCLADVASLAAPLGLAFGRLGNFINGELWGRVTDLPWGMIFVASGDDLPRHPSQLYELVAEGLLLFAVLLIVSKRKPPAGIVSTLFLLGYGLARFMVEFIREADAHMGYYWLDLTAGQLLSLPMIVVGCVSLALFLLIARRRAGTRN